MSTLNTDESSRESLKVHILFSHHAQGQADNMVTRLDDLKQAVDADVSSLEALQDDVQRNKAVTGDLLAAGKDVQQVLKHHGKD